MIKMRLVFESELDTILEPDSEMPKDVCKALLAAANGMRASMMDYIAPLFDDEVFRRFCQCHAQFRTGISRGAYGAPQPFEKCIASLLIPRSGDVDCIDPKVDPELQKILAKHGLEVEPSCIFIPDAVVLFDSENRNDYGAYDDVAVAIGLYPEWPSNGRLEKLEIVREYLKKQPIVKI